MLTLMLTLVWLRCWLTHAIPWLPSVHVCVHSGGVGVYIRWGCCGSVCMVSSGMKISTSCVTPAPLWSRTLRLDRTSSLNSTATTKKSCSEHWFVWRTRTGGVTPTLRCCLGVTASLNTSRLNAPEGLLSLHYATLEKGLYTLRSVAE